MSEIPQYKAGDTVTYRCAGYGVVTYETDTVQRQDGTSLYTNNYDRMEGLQWNGREFAFNGGMGLRTTVVLNDDPAALKFMADES